MMKHLKYFENKEVKFKKDDMVILLKDNSDTPYSASGIDFKVGGMYIIKRVDHIDNEFLISYIDRELIMTWVREDQIRKAEDWELDQNKYNL